MGTTTNAAAPLGMQDSEMPQMQITMKIIHQSSDLGRAIGGGGGERSCRLSEAVISITHNYCFRAKIRK